MRIQNILILLLASVSLTGQGIMLAGGAVAEEPAGIVTTDLLVYLDANNASSYGGSGTAWTNLVSGGIDFTLQSNVTFNSTNNFFTTGGANKAILSNSNISFGTDFTWSGWFYVLDNSANSMLIDAYVYNSSQDCYLLQAQASRGGIELHGRPINTDVYTLFVQSTVDASYSTPLNQWFYVTVTKEDGASTSTYSLYVNGNLIVSKTNTVGYGDTFTDIYTLGSNDGTFSGRTDVAEVHLYNRALTAEEVLQNYNATNRF